MSRLCRLNHAGAYRSIRSFWKNLSENQRIPFNPRGDFCKIGAPGSRSARIDGFSSRAEQALRAAVGDFCRGLPCGSRHSPPASPFNPAHETQFPVGDPSIPSRDCSFPARERRTPSGEPHGPDGETPFPRREIRFPLREPRFPSGDSLFPSWERQNPVRETPFPSGENAFPPK